jgi:uncharacterized protein
MMSQPTEEPETILEEIDPPECAVLMAATQFGRIAVVVSGQPVIVVLNHLMVGGNVVFRVGEDSRLAGLTDGTSVHASYEVDSAFPVGHAGWSVIATGTLDREPTESVAVAAREHLATWAGGRREVVLRLRIQGLSGRRAGRL